MIPGLDAVLFDLGGTLDGPGGWRDRFHRQFTACGLGETFAHDRRVRAFDYAEDRSHARADMASVGLRDLVRLHVEWQFESLGAVAGTEAAATIVERFVREVEAACDASRQVLAALREDGYRLGVVSNGCGNVAVLCEEYGFAPMLSVVVDSQVFGRAKPDRTIFLHALAQLGADPSRAAFVGDSLDRDMEPAKALGLRTFWLADAHRRTQVPPGVVDVALDRIEDLPKHLGQAVR
jgi:HAD superfamily hydrolase (TIGR01549 family)